MHYQRTILIEKDLDFTKVELQDDFHHFSISVHCNASQLTALSGRSVRTPWSTCGGASSVLHSLVGRSFDTRGLSLPHEERAGQCLHLMDMVELAVAHSQRTARSRAYVIEVVRGVRPEDPIDARLVRNDEPVLSWHLDKSHVCAAPPYDSLPRAAIGGLKRDRIAAWAQVHLDADGCEATLVLHRAIMVSGSKYFDWQSPRTSAERSIPSFCFAHDPARAAVARPTPENFRDSSTTRIHLSRRESPKE